MHFRCRNKPFATLRHVVPTVIAFSLLVASTLSAAAVGDSPLFRKVEGSKAARQTFATKTAAVPIALDKQRLSKLARNDELDLTLPNGESYRVVFDRIEDHGGGIRSSVGLLKGLNSDFRVIVTTGPTGSFGSIQAPGAYYRIVPGDGADFLVDAKAEMALGDPIDLRDDARRAPPPPEAEIKRIAEAVTRTRLQVGGEAAISTVTPTPQATIDLMIVYTNFLAAHLGQNLMTRLYNLVTAANTAYANSEVAITLRLVNAMQITTAGDGGCPDQGTLLDAITPGVGGGGGIYSGIEPARTASGADLVAFMRDGQDFGGCGLAWLTASSSPNANFMYSVTNGCVLGCDSVFIHELGHNMGNAHDRATAAFQDTADASGNKVANPGAFPYSFGHFYCVSGTLTCNPNLDSAHTGCAIQPTCSTSNANNMGTIMSYFNPVTLKFSNPNIMCMPAGNGATTPQPCGVAAGMANAADNAQSMNNLRLAIQGLKTASPPISNPPGALQFTNLNFTATKNGGMATLTVQRIAGSVGAMSVNYTTQNGTAVAGNDFTTTSGTLNWANGDTANKTITVPILNDGTMTPEAFTVVLSAPGGSTGAFIGFPGTATVNIVPPDTFPQGCQIPAGWVVPGTANAGWSVASDRTQSGSCSLKSDDIVDSGVNGTFTKAQIEYTANFQAGSVVFQHNISSEASWDCLRFLVDDVRQNIGTGCGGSGNPGVSGDTNTWVSVSIPIAAGMRKLTWSYEKDYVFSTGLDTAWIDSVSLPPLTNFTLTAAKTGTGTGTVSGTGINCGADCNEVFPWGTVVALTATPNAGSAFTGWSGGGCSGIGTCIVTVSANTTVTATFTLQQSMLTVTRSGAGTGTVTSDVGGINCGVTTCSATLANNTVVTLTANPAMGSTFGGWTSGGCSGTGTCVVTLTMATTVDALFNLPVAPGAPTLNSITAGNTQATAYFSAPASDGGAPITQYLVQCPDAAAVQPTRFNTGLTSPIVVTGMVNGVTYNCRVIATNSAGNSPTSNQISVTPVAAPPIALVSVDSRKTHGGVTKYKVPIALGVPLAGAITVEPRSASSHEIVFTFDTAVTSVGSVSANIGNASASFSGNEVSVTLSNVTDNQRIAISVNAVNGVASATANIGLLVGDVSNSRNVSVVDIAAIKARSGNNVTSDATARYDILTNGSVGSTDLSVVKARSGTALVP